MSRLKKRANKKPIRSIASEWLNNNLQPVAVAITARTFARDRELQKKYGDLGRKKCEEDTVYHLHYLAEAAANNSPKMFVDYVGWAKIMLCSRGMDAAKLAQNLDAMVHVLRLKSPRDCKKIFARFIGSAAAQLHKLPESLPSFIDGGNPLAELADSYLRSLLLLNREEAISLVLRRLESGLTIRELFRLVIHPVQQEVGRLWQENRISVVQEHYCSAATDLLISRVQRRFVGVSRSVAAIAICPDGEEHSLGIKMFADLLESDGWMVAYLGAKCPMADVLKLIRIHGTDLVAISVATLLNLAKARELIKGIRSLPVEHAPVIIVGGAAVNSNPEICEHLEADGWAADVSEGVDVANRLVAARKRERAHPMMRA